MTGIDVGQPAGLDGMEWKGKGKDGGELGRNGQDGTRWDDVTGQDRKKRTERDGRNGTGRDGNG